jgi:hypothetical protein
MTDGYVRDFRQNVNSTDISGEGENRANTTSPEEVNSAENATVSGALGPAENGSSAPQSIEAAREYMRHGIPVFPCRDNSKKPATTHGFKDAETDPCEAEKWRPNCNIAFCPDSAGLFVVDLDGEAGLRSWRHLETLYGAPETLRVRTPSGGTHIYFKGHGRSTAGALGRGIDTRGVGGYVLLPPSTIDGRSYKFLDGGVFDRRQIAEAPQWLLDALDKPVREAREAPENFVEDDPFNVDWARFNVEQAIGKGDLPTIGTRDTHATRWFIQLNKYGCSEQTAREIYERFYAEGGARPDHPSDHDDKIERIWAGLTGDNEAGAEAPQKPSEIFGEAVQAAGIAAPPKTFRERLIKIRNAAGGDGPRFDPPPDMPVFMTAAELDAYAFPVENDIWHGLVLRQLVNLLYGDGKTGKTMLCGHIGVAAAAGLGKLFGHDIAKLPVVMVLCEDAYKRVLPAMREICRSLGVNLGDLPITFCCRPDDPVLAIIGTEGQFSNELTPFARQICERIAALGECLVVLDTVSDIAELNENLRLPPNTLCKKVLQPICDAFGATIIVNCHPSEAQRHSGRMTSGSTSWKNAVRNVLALTLEKDEIRKLERLYTNYGGEGGALFLRLTGPVYTQTEAPVGGTDDGDKDMKFLLWHLRDRGAIDWAHGLTDEQAAEIFAGDEPDEKDVEGMRVWRTAVASRKKFLRNRKRSAAWRKYGTEECQLGGTAPIWKWYAAPIE